MDVKPRYHKNLKDLTGRKFHRLTVLHRDESLGLTVVRWVCRCDCGVVKSIRANKLNSGNTVSCGCWSREQNRTKTTTDVTGQKIGRLLVLGREGSRRALSTWSVLCDCGIEKVVTGLYLKSSQMPSCGCAEREAAAARRFVDLSGEVFGKLTAVEHLGFNKSRKAIWRCLCECGREKVTLGASLRSGRAISCGCARKEERAYMTEKARAESSEKCARRRARKAEAKGSYTAAEIAELYKRQRGRCASCRTKLGTDYHRDHIEALSNGGTNDIYNIQLLCPGCNHRKHAKDPIAWANENGLLL